MTLASITAILFSVFVLGISAYFYKHKDRAYAQGKTKKINTPRIFSRIYRYLQMSTLIAIIYSHVAGPEAWGVLFQNSFSIYFGLAIVAFAAALFVASKVNLGASYSPCFDSYVPRDIVRSGIYKYIRHPIYTSNILLLVGFFVSTGNVVLAANTLILIYFYWISAGEEEKELQREFPSYAEYMKHTGRFFPRFLYGVESTKIPHEIIQQL